MLDLPRLYPTLLTAQPAAAAMMENLEALLQKRCADGSLGESALLWAEARYRPWREVYHNVSKFIAPSCFMRDAAARRFGDDKVVHIPAME